MEPRIAVIIPSLGAATLSACIDALAGQNRRPDCVIVVLSGGGHFPEAPLETTVVTSRRRIGFAEAVNRGLATLPDDIDLVALLNDDAEPAPEWLDALSRAMQNDPELAAVQGTVIDALDPDTVDGRGLAVTSLGLPVQVDRGLPANEGDRLPEPRLGVSATAALYRREALNAIRAADDTVFYQRLGAYHEDTDLALRLGRIGWRAAWIPGAPCLHRGSTTGRRRVWRHPWWLLANRWRVLISNLTPIAFIVALPKLVRGEVRAVATLMRSNGRAGPVALAVLLSLPWFTIEGWLRRTPGPRLVSLPGGAP